MKYGIPTQGLQKIPMWRIGNETKGMSCARATPCFDPLKVTHENYPKFIHIPNNVGMIVEEIGTHLFAENGMDDFYWGHSSSEMQILRKAGVNVERILPEEYEHFTVPKHPYYSCSLWHRPIDWWRVEGYDFYDDRRTFCVVRNPLARAMSEVNQWRTIRNITCLKSSEAENIIITTLSKLKEKAISFGGKEYKYPHDDCQWEAQVNYVFDGRGCRVCDDVVYFEDLAHQLTILFTAYGFNPQFNFMKFNFNKCKLPKMKYETVQSIVEAYEMDFLAFGYSTHL